MRRFPPGRQSSARTKRQCCGCYRHRPSRSFNRRLEREGQRNWNWSSQVNPGQHQWTTVGHKPCPRIQRYSTIRPMGASPCTRQDSTSRRRRRLLSRRGGIWRSVHYTFEGLRWTIHGRSKTNPSAEFIPEITAKNLIAMGLPTLPIEPVVLELLVAVSRS